LQEPDNWQDHKKLNELNKEKTITEQKLSEFQSIQNQINDIGDLISISVELGELDELEKQSDALSELNAEIDSLETKKYFSRETDPNNAFLDIQSGSGGTEAQDWAEMLYRMYTRWAEDMNFKVRIEEYSVGDVAGIKSASIHISGQYAYGWLRTETGIHRLVRKSPFDSGNRRHTSFAAVFVSPEIDDDIEIDLDMSKVRIDTYRASGAGGQHVNKTDSAVRLTHEPTGLVVQCQSQRSQHQNKDRAIKQLKSRLYELEMQKKEEEIQKIEDSKTDIGWGNQIRSYVLDQSRIKDIRTKHEETNTQSVLDGKINNFIKESLKNGY
tara:strand:+ start:4180 stop:5157 length:978 start_codon:yes stop_codon:yes gene_type:complete